MNVRNAFTVDVEDYYHVTAFEKQIQRSHWEGYESRVVGNTRRMLELLKRHEVRATFFVLGWVAERFPDLVRQILDAGHEVGSHGYWHRLIYHITPDEFRRDLRRARDALATASCGDVLSYRAPSFSITRSSLWALEILTEEGFRYDSSIFPVHHDRYGIPDANPAIHRIDTACGPLWEFPVSVVRMAGVNLPVSGGGYFRLYPLRWSLRWLSRINTRFQRPFVFYVHPWEIDPQQPRVKVRSPISRLRHYVNLESTERKLEELLKAFQFGRLCDVIEQSPSAAT